MVYGCDLSDEFRWAGVLAICSAAHSLYRSLTNPSRSPASLGPKRLVEWLRRTTDGDQPTVEVRRLTTEFLHGKAFIAVHPTLPGVLAGSSNLTYAGLMRNRELNLGYPSNEYTHIVIDWFDELWDLADPFDLAAICEARWQPHEPWTVFLRMLYELYGIDDEDDFAVTLGLNLTGFQRDGVARALRR